MELAHRVLARFIAADTQAMTRDEGDFVVEFLPRHQAVVEAVAAKVHAAIKHYRSAGIAIRHKLLVQLDGKGASKVGGLYWIGSQPPTLKIAPKMYNNPGLTGVISHELGHYIHDRIVPSGTANPEIYKRYVWAVRQKQSVRETENEDDLKRLRVKEIEAEIRELRAVRSDALPPKGKVFDYQWWNYWKRHHLTLQAKILRKSGKNVDLEIIAPPHEYTQYLPQAGRRTPQGNPIVTVPALELANTEVQSGVSDGITKLQEERQALELALISRNDARDSEWQERYEVQRHIWAPTQYSRKNKKEWFAELCTTFALGHLDPVVVEWLLSVISTGEAPKSMSVV